MPVYDAEPYLHQSIRSILNQTFQDFQLIIISEHDTSAESIQIIQSYSDPRIRHIHNERRLGLVQSRNVGLGHANGEYIACMDADDVSAPERLEKQVQFLDGHPEIGVVGTAFAIIDQQGRVISNETPPSEPGLTRWLMLFSDIVANSSVMARRTVYGQLGGFKSEPCPFLAGGPQSSYAEDYEFWARASRITRITNIPEVLLGLRMHDRSLSRVCARAVYECRVQIVRLAVANALGRDVSLNLVEALLQPNSARPADALAAATMVYDLCLRYVSQKTITKHEERLVRFDAASRLFLLATACVGNSPFFFARICRLMILLCEWSPEFAFLTFRRSGAYLCWRLSQARN